MKVNEIWKPVLGAENYYEVSNAGLVRSVRFVNNMVDKLRDEPKILRQQTDRKGYKRVTLPLPEKKNRTVHRIVLEAFVGPCPKGMECAHLNGNPADNRLENLKWCTRSENFSHKELHGTGNKGAKNPKAILKEAQVVKIKKLLEKGDCVAQIARDYKVARQTIDNIKRGVRWSHV